MKKALLMIGSAALALLTTLTLSLSAASHEQNIVNEQQKSEIEKVKAELKMNREYLDAREKILRWQAKWGAFCNGKGQILGKQSNAAEVFSCVDRPQPQSPTPSAPTPAPAKPEAQSQSQPQPQSLPPAAKPQQEPSK